MLLLAAALPAAGAATADPVPASRIFVGSYDRPPAKEGYSYPDCYCTDSEGRRVEMGERACLSVGKRQMTAICGMSLNTPAWRMEAEGCPVS